MDLFAQILYDLGQEIGVKLYPDSNRICEINYQDQLHLQIHHDEPKERLLIASFICEVPPGKYREKLFKSALISNGMSPTTEILGYSERNNQLTLFTYVPIAKLTGESLFKLLQAFLKKAHYWKDAVENGKPLPISPDSGEKGSMFGLKP